MLFKEEERKGQLCARDANDGQYDFASRSSTDTTSTTATRRLTTHNLTRDRSGGKRIQCMKTRGTSAQFVIRHASPFYIHCYQTITGVLARNTRTVLYASNYRYSKFSCRVQIPTVWHRASTPSIRGGLHGTWSLIWRGVWKDSRRHNSILRMIVRNNN